MRVLDLTRLKALLILKNIYDDGLVQHILTSSSYAIQFGLHPHDKVCSDTSLCMTVLAERLEEKRESFRGGGNLF